jgi:hypothetical protein
MSTFNIVAVIRRWCLAARAAADSQARCRLFRPTRTPGDATAVASPHVHPSVSPLHRRPRASVDSGWCYPPDFSRPRHGQSASPPLHPFGAQRLRCGARQACPVELAFPASSRRFRPLTSLSRCGCPALEPIQLGALRPRCGPLLFPERSFASGEDV